MRLPFLPKKKVNQTPKPTKAKKQRLQSEYEKSQQRREVYAHKLRRRY